MAGLAFRLYPEALARAEACLANCCSAIFRYPTGLYCQINNLWGRNHRGICCDHCLILSLFEGSSFRASQGGRVYSSWR